jgi:uncharacterized protein YcfJ
MKRMAAIVCLIAMSVSQAGCASSPNRAAEGGVVGGLLGAGAGLIIGNQMDDRDKGRTQGALIGGAIGALGGALAGSKVQKQPSPQQAAAQQAANPNQMSISQIADMGKQGINEDVIVDRIRLTNSKYRLSQADIDYLKANGVSQKVLFEMQSN